MTLTDGCVYWGTFQQRTTTLHHLEAMSNSSPSSPRPTWKRICPGRYVSSTGWTIEQFQGDLHPKWGLWEPGQDPLMEEEFDRYGTLRDAKAAAFRCGA